MSSIEELDRWIGSKVKRWTARLSGETPAPELLEIRRDLLESLRDQLEPKGHGRYLFPHQKVAIRIAAESEPKRELYEEAFADFEGEVRAFLTEAGADAASVSVEVSAEVDTALAWTARPFRVDYARRAAAVAAAAPTAPTKRERPAASLTVLRGTAEPAELPITANQVNLGRMKEVTGEKEGLRRINHVAFAEDQSTVSREHATINFDPESGWFRIRDTGSQRGTSVFRDGRRIEVTRGSSRGTQLKSGDEIHLGDARVRFDAQEA